MRRFFKWFFTAAAILTLAVIWHFSLQSGEESGEVSGSFTETLNGFLSRLGLSLRLSDSFLRKAAHFSEFALLGALTFAAFSLHGFSHAVLLSFPAAVLAAAVDETIQIFSPGRGPAVADVLLDSAGGAFGIAAAFLLSCLVAILYQKKCEKKEKST